jgi:antimicrobial peptide system SdpA family protein
MTRPGAPILTKVSIILGWSVLVVLVMRAFMPDNPLRISRAVKDNLTVLIPQGWVFFTRDPREPSDRLYLRTTPCCRPVTQSNGGAGNLFGLNRDSRALSVELGSLIGQAPASAWSQCRGDLNSCIASSTAPAAVRNASTSRQLCGEVLVHRSKPVPWAWSRDTHVDPPYALLRMNVSCR